MKTWHKDIAHWEIGKALYLSVPFTWLLRGYGNAINAIRAEEFIRAYRNTQGETC